jgi:glycosyltransferase involved in cell wall biosynthesis
MTARPALSVIIPVRNGAATIGAQLSALATQSCDRSWEVVVADNGSTDDTVPRVRAMAERLPAVRVVHASARAGAGFARNAGASAAEGDYLLFIDADDIVQPGWLAAMSDAASRHPLIAGALREEGARTADPRAGLGRETTWSRILSSEGFLDAAASSNLGVSRALWDEVGGFREAMVASEDTAFCWDAQLLGHRIHRVEDAVVTYRMRSSLRGLWRQQYLWGMAAAQLYALYRDRGAPRSSTRGALARWAGLLVLAPLTLFSADQRRDWVGRAARRAGRLRGSIRFRVLFL